MLLVLLLAAAAVGCDDDPVRPEGRAGVISYNATFSVQDAIINGNVASEQYTIEGLTPSVVDGGAVLVYFQDQDTWTAMPFTVGAESPDLAAVDYTWTLGYAYDVEFLEVFVEASADFVLQELDVVYPIKIVLIDNFFAAKSGVDLRNYEEVKRHFGLED